MSRIEVKSEVRGELNSPNAISPPRLPRESSLPLIASQLEAINSTLADSSKKTSIPAISQSLAELDKVIRSYAPKDAEEQAKASILRMQTLGTLMQVSANDSSQIGVERLQGAAKGIRQEFEKLNSSAERSERLEGLENYRVALSLNQARLRGDAKLGEEYYSKNLDRLVKSANLAVSSITDGGAHARVPMDGVDLVEASGIRRLPKPKVSAMNIDEASVRESYLKLNKDQRVELLSEMVRGVDTALGVSKLDFAYRTHQVAGELLRVEREINARPSANLAEALPKKTFEKLDRAFFIGKAQLQASLGEVESAVQTLDEVRSSLVGTKDNAALSSALALRVAYTIALSGEDRKYLPQITAARQDGEAAGLSKEFLANLRLQEATAYLARGESLNARNILQATAKSYGDVPGLASTVRKLLSDKDDGKVLAALKATLVEAGSGTIQEVLAYGASAAVLWASGGARVGTAFGGIPGMAAGGVVGGLTGFAFGQAFRVGVNVARGSSRIAGAYQTGMSGYATDEALLSGGSAALDLVVAGSAAKLLSTSSMKILASATMAEVVGDAFKSGLKADLLQVAKKELGVDLSKLSERETRDVLAKAFLVHSEQLAGDIERAGGKLVSRPGVALLGAQFSDLAASYQQLDSDSAISDQERSVKKQQLLANAGKSVALIATMSAGTHAIKSVASHADGIASTFSKLNFNFEFPPPSAGMVAFGSNGAIASGATFPTPLLPPRPISPSHVESRVAGRGGKISMDRRELLSLIFDGDKPRYVGVEGYREFADRFFNGSMTVAFDRVSGVLTASEFKKLQWGNSFIGLTTEHGALRAHLFVGDTPRAELTGLDGYKRFADEQFGGVMNKTFKNTAAVLSKSEFKKLGWGKQFIGTTAEHSAVRAALFAGDTFRTEFTGVEGYKNFANQRYAGAMQPAILSVSAVLTDGEFKKLGWGKAFVGSTAEHSAIRAKLFAGDTPRNDLTGIEGYKKFADEHYLGVMVKAYANVSAVLTESEFKKLGWGKAFMGSTAEHSALRETLFLENSPRAEVRGIEGYKNVADTYYAGAMKKAFTNASAVLTDGEFKRLEWGKQFGGSTADHTALRAKLFSGSTPHSEFTGVEGYRTFADKHYAGEMKKAFENASAILTDKEFKKLGWGKAFAGSTTEHRALRATLFDGDTPRTEITGLSGYKAFADEQYAGSMAKAFSNASAVLSESEFKKLGWGKAFMGSTAEHSALRETLFLENSPRAEVRGIEGYKNVADTYYAGAMKKAFTNASAVLTDGEFKRLEWGKQFGGSTADHTALRAKLFSGSTPHSEFTGVSGYKKFADERSAGAMKKAFENASAVLSPTEFSKLGWGIVFQGTTVEHDVASNALRRILDGEDRSYYGISGRRVFASQFARDDMARAYNYASAILTKPEFERLNWGVSAQK